MIAMHAHYDTFWLVYQLLRQIYLVAYIIPHAAWIARDYLELSALSLSHRIMPI